MACAVASGTPSFVNLSTSPNLVFSKELVFGGEKVLPGPDWFAWEGNRLPPQVEIVRTERGFAALEPQWDALVAGSFTRSPFLRWDWVRLWWETFREDYELAIVVVKNAFGTPEGIAPLVLGRSTNGARRYLRQLCWLGGVGEVEGEVMDFLVPEGRERELTPLLCEGIRQLAPHWQGVRLNKIPEASPNLPVLLDCLKGFSAGSGVVNAHTSWCTSLPEDWDHYAARHSGRWRRNLRKRWEVLVAEHGAEKGLAGQTMPAGAAMEQLGRLHCGRWCGGASTFVRDRAWAFHQRLAEKWIPQGQAILPYLAIDGRMVAGCYGFLEGDRFYHYQLGWDCQYADLSLGNLAVKTCLEHCLGLGAKHYDMLSGEYRYKSEWCPQERKLIDVEGYSPFSPTAACFLGLRSIKRLIYTVPGSPEAEAEKAEEVGEG